MHSAESISGGPSGLLGRRAQRMHKGRHIFCRAASMARISGRERASLVRRVGAAVERHAPKIMKMSMLVGAMACLAGTRSSSCMPRPVDLDETLEPTFTDGARKYWHLRFTCPCNDLFTAVRDGRPKPSMDWNASPTILAKKSTLSLDKYFYRFITWTQDDPIGVDDDDVFFADKSAKWSASPVEGCKSDREYRSGSSHASTTCGAAPSPARAPSAA
ncbi:hypothetical protein JL722_10361 [Aureococcus anophagefferens]|nr:hypothetical protein JL722_10361 [Aureococcus anophagefferens]